MFLCFVIFNICISEVTFLIEYDKFKIAAFFITLIATFSLVIKHSPSYIAVSFVSCINLLTS